MLNIPKVGKIWFSGVPDISLNGFDAIIGLDSGLDSVLMKDKVFSIRGRTVSYQVGVPRGQDKNAEIQAAIDKVLASFEDVFTETPYQSVYENGGRRNICSLGKKDNRSYQEF